MPRLDVDTGERTRHRADQHATVAAIGTAGDPQPTLIHMTSKYSFNDHRIALAAAVTGCLTTFPQ